MADVEGASEGPPPGPVGRPLPPPPPPPARPTWWVALLGVGVVIVAIAAAVGIAVLATRDDDDASSSRSAAPRPATTVVPDRTAPPAPEGATFTDPEGSYTIVLGPDWSDVTAQMSAGTEAWTVAASADGYAPNVNVLTQQLPGIDVPTLLAGTVADVERVGGTVLDQAVVTTADGTRLGRIAYALTAPATGDELAFLAVFAAAGGIAVVATLTAPPDRFADLAAAVEPYLATLRLRR